MLTLPLVMIIIILSYVVGLYIQMLYKFGRKVRIVDSSKENNIIIREYKQAPGPVPWPIIGNLTLLARFRVPFEGFTELSKELGDIYSLTLGSTRCLVVNNLELIREVLNQNGKFFGGRPDFFRYHKLFGGDRNNSLALCDWSSLQQKRRNLARRHCSPRNSSSYFLKMSNVGSFEASELMEKMNEKVNPGEEFEIKPLIQQTCANMFTQYMCSMRFDYEDTDFQTIVKYFDEIFWEINQGYALDFLPWLSPFYKKHTNTIVGWSNSIRKFILERIINEREQNLDLDEPETDFTDALLKSLIEDKNVSRDTIIYMLEDFIGGHSAVGNLVMMALAYIARNPLIGKQIQMEVDGVSNNGQRKINLYDMENMPYTMATIFEVLRYSSSPIVPHVATEDTVIAGFGVTEGTVVFINNYKLNTSSQYWKNPELFQPHRFLEILDDGEFSKSQASTKSSKNNSDNTKRRNSEGSDSGIEYDKETLTISSSVSESSVLNSSTKFQNVHKAKHWRSEKVQIKKNIPHFLPFSIGKRTCIGQNLVRGFGFILLANIIQQYNVTSNNLSSIITVPACVALPTKTFPLVFIPRKNHKNN
ncbi:Cytochrome P450 307a1 [Lucilia cuprina]|uniref:Cytochrome P450 307a1 n=1 Tax=Lucilia cuprina TaxID=7375 RepID=A0A0L0BU33_LUCCU|nr:Cytochrome P450 307a1 [Lucilia cuprina]KNC23557.1 Cytochrome P450 307a1 [Lucilia cuprina]